MKITVKSIPWLLAVFFTLWVETVPANELTQQTEPNKSVFRESLSEMVSIGGIIAAAYQFESPNGPSGAEHIDRGAIPIRLEVSIKPTETDEIFLKAGFAGGNGLNTDNHSFVLAPWAAGLEDDVKDINGRGRNYLLSAWYAHTFSFGEGHNLGITGGIIDATDYLDDNAYANSEYTQFMNEALVNGLVAFLPSYDIGGALAWEMGSLSIRGVIMGIGKNDEDRTYTFYGVQAGYTVDTPFGAGTYRVLADMTSKDFGNPDRTSREALKALTFSCNQEIGELLGTWVRFGWSDDKASIDFSTLYSGGIQISGKVWGRENDHIGLGYAYLDRGNQGIKRTQLVEGYVRFALGPIFAVTLDGQYLDDIYEAGARDNVHGWITGLRLTAQF